MRDVAATLAFYVDVSSFEKRELSEDGSFGLGACGEVGVMLVRCDDDAALTATVRNITVYVWVDGVDAYYEALKPRLIGLPQERVRPPFNQPYGIVSFTSETQVAVCFSSGEEPPTNGRLSCWPVNIQKPVSLVAVFSRGVDLRQTYLSHSSCVVSGLTVFEPFLL